METNIPNLEKLIEKIILYKENNDPRNQLCIEKYDTNWILNEIGESDELQRIENKFKEYDVKGVDLIDFVRILLSVIEHKEEQTLYIVMSIIDLFKEISESFGLSNIIQASDVINYIVEVIFILFMYFHFLIDFHSKNWLFRVITNQKSTR